MSLPPQASATTQYPKRRQIKCNTSSNHKKFPKQNPRHKTHTHIKTKNQRLVAAAKQAAEHSKKKKMRIANLVEEMAKR
jgi:hypothetical protein